MKSIYCLFVVSGLVVLLSRLENPISLPETALAQTADPVFVGAGDITNCSRTQDEATAQLLDGIAGTVFTLGDNTYPDGTPAQFNDCYGPSWGRHKTRTKPAPGNHDYHTPGAAGYYSYFGAAASPLETNCTSNCKGYYSYDLGAWHIIVLNSEIAHEAGSAQEQWLRADLAAHQNVCTLAYWHKPRFSSGLHGNNSGVQSLWQALYEYKADLVLNGHDHTYERFAPQNPSGQADPTRGIREFVVGTGGAGFYDFPIIRPNSEVRNNTTNGVLKLTLHPTSYDWEFIPVAGQTFTDSGAGNCVGAGSAPTATPTNTPPPGTTPTPSALEVRVAASSDDAEESATGKVDLTSTDLEMVMETSLQTVGIRFNGITIPQGATITNAYIQFQVDETDTQATSLIIQGEAVDNAATFTAATNNISARPRTTAAVSWSSPSWTTAGQAGLDQRTPNLTSVLQEIIARPGWSNGNSLVIIITGSGKRTAEALDGVPGAAPLLHIEYDTSTATLPNKIYLPIIWRDISQASAPAMGLESLSEKKTSFPGCETQFRNASGCPNLREAWTPATHVMRKTSQKISLSHPLLTPNRPALCFPQVRLR
ncbi:MAG: metallophosphoesterase [Anaerolineae bacterium]